MGLTNPGVIRISGSDATYSGTVRITGGPNVTVGTDASGLSISGGGFSGGVSNLGNTAGSTGVTGTRLVLVGSQNVSLSQSTDANGGTISFSAAGGGAGQFSGGVSNLGNTAGATGITGTRLVFVGTNNITLSQTTDANGGTISISGGAGGGGLASAGFSTQGNTSGNTGFASNSFQIVGGNNITLSGATAAGQVTITVSAPNTIQAPAMGVSTGGNTSGNTTVDVGTRFVLAGQNVTLSQSTAASATTITISGEKQTASMWWPYNEGVNVAGQQGQATLNIVPLRARGDELYIDRLAIPIYWSNSSNSTGTVSLSLWFGMSTRNVSTLSSAHSTSYTTQFTFSGNNSSESLRGIKLHTIPWTTTISDARYYIGVASRTSTGGGNGTMSQMLLSQLNSNFSGIFIAASNRSNQWPLGFGVLSASTTQLPASIAFSQIDGTGSLAARPPTWFMISGTA